MKSRLLFLSLLIISLTIQAGSFEFYQPVSQFLADKSTLDRKYTIRYSSEYFDRMEKLYNDWITELENIDYEALSLDGKTDYLNFQNYLNRHLFFLSLSRTEYKKVAHVSSFADPLYTFIRQRRRGYTPDGAQKARILHQAKQDAERAIASLDSKPYFSSWIEAENAAMVIKDLRQNLEDAFQFYYGYHPEFTWWAKLPYQQLEEVLQKYETLLAGHYDPTKAADDGSGIIGRPEGREAMIKRLLFEFIPYTPEELITIGEREFAWCRSEMIRAAQEMGFGNDWRAALEHVKNQYVPAGTQPEMVNRLAEKSIAFMEENDLITIPLLAQETWRMVMMSPERQLVNPFFLGGEAIWISYPTHTMDHDAKLMSLRGNNPHFCMATVHHELIAGHHLQGFMNQRYKPYRRALGTPFWLEGWALYWEFLLYEKGLPQTPEDRMGFLFWRKHRAARIIFSLKFHLQQMTPQECIDFLVNDVGHERANAEAEVRRSFTSRYDPLYQLAYMIGGIQFQALRQELVDSGKMSFRQFHDIIMKQNNIPVELLRAVLKDQQLPKDFTTNWRFAD